MGHEQILHTFWVNQVARSSEPMCFLIQQHYIITSPNYGQLLNPLEIIVSTLRHLAKYVMGRKHNTIEKMTVEKLKSYPGLESLTDQEATEILSSFEKLANVLFISQKKMKSSKE